MADDGIGPLIKHAFEVGEGHGVSLRDADESRGLLEELAGGGELFDLIVVPPLVGEREKTVGIENSGSR